MSSQKTIVLQSSDGQTFEIEEAVALESETIKYMIEDDCADSTIPLSRVTGNILSMVIEYCKMHMESSNNNEEDLKSFDSEFINVDHDTLVNLVVAANFLNIKKLLDLTCQTMSDLIKKKSVEEIRQMFDIKNDYTPEEEETVRKENAWAFE